MTLAHTGSVSEHTTKLPGIGTASDRSQADSERPMEMVRGRFGPDTLNPRQRLSLLDLYPSSRD